MTWTKPSIVVFLAVVIGCIVESTDTAIDAAAYVFIGFIVLLSYKIMIKDLLGY